MSTMSVGVEETAVFTLLQKLDPEKELEFVKLVTPELWLL